MTCLPGVQTNFVQAICGTCRKPITLNLTHQIDGMASCYYCHHDHEISRNVLPRPYKLPRSRKLIDRSKQDVPLNELFETTSARTTTAATQAFLNNPKGGL